MAFSGPERPNTTLRFWRNHTPVRPPENVAEEGPHIFHDDAWPTRRIGWIQRQKSTHPDKPWIAYYAPTSTSLPVFLRQRSSATDAYRGKVR